MFDAQAQGPVNGRVMKMWLLGSADPSADINSLSHLRDSETGDANRLVRFPKGTAVARWRAYMESYVLSSPTELVDEQLKGRLRRTFLARCVKLQNFIIYPSVLLTSSLMFYSHHFFWYGMYLYSCFASCTWMFMCVGGLGCTLRVVLIDGSRLGSARDGNRSYL